LDRYIERIRNHEPAVLSLHPTSEGLPAPKKKQQYDDQPPRTFQRQARYCGDVLGSRPEVGIELDSRTAFAKLLGQINLYGPEWMP
jgi:hypothetical protein